MRKALSLHSRKLRGLVAIATVFLSFLPALAQQPAQDKNNPFKIFQYRQIGPFRGGRVNAVAGVPSQPNVYYFGATGGGVFKTTDGGVNWVPVSDDYFKNGSVGSIAVADSDPNIPHGFDQVSFF